jgi:hypothetical protein
VEFSQHAGLFIFVSVLDRAAASSPFTPELCAKIHQKASMDPSHNVLSLVKNHSQLTAQNTEVQKAD